MGAVPKKTKAENRIARHLSLMKVFGFIMTVAVASQVSDMFVNQKFDMLFLVFCCIEYLIASSGSPSDPTKNFGRAWLDWLSYSFGKSKMHTEREVNENCDEIIEAESTK